MSQSNSFASRTLSHSKYQAVPSKNQIMQWVHNVLPHPNLYFTIESLGTGEIYCAIMTHYFPGIIISNRIIAAPCNQYEYSLNLRQFQNSLTKARFNINFDIQKVVKLRFSQNWSLIVSLYKMLEAAQPIKDFKEVRTPKRQLKQCQLIQEKKVVDQNKYSQSQAAKKTDVFGMGSILSQVQRVKQILLSSANDTYKVIMIRKLFGIEEVKQEEEIQQISHFHVKKYLQKGQYLKK